MTKHVSESPTKQLSVRIDEKSFPRLDAIVTWEESKLIDDNGGGGIKLRRSDVVRKLLESAITNYYKENGIPEPEVTELAAESKVSSRSSSNKKRRRSAARQAA